MEEKDKRYEQAKSRVAKVRAFYTNVISFVLINIMLLVINLITDPHSLWFYWVTIIWGCILAAQAINTFTLKDRFLGEEWEKKEIKKILDKDNSHKH
jgi:hypothetical protein